jgi:hypothetical protein
VLKSVTLGSTYQSIIKEVQNSYVGYIAFIGNGKKIKTLKNQLMNFGYTYAIGVFSNPSENLQTKSTLTIMKKTGDIKAGNVPNIVQKISGSFQCS